MSYSQLSKISVSSPASSQLGNDLIESIKSFVWWVVTGWRRSIRLKSCVEKDCCQGLIHSYAIKLRWVEAVQWISSTPLKLSYHCWLVLWRPAKELYHENCHMSVTVLYSTVQYSKEEEGWGVCIIHCVESRSQAERIWGSVPASLAVPLLHFNRGKCLLFSKWLRRKFVWKYFNGLVTIYQMTGTRLVMTEVRWYGEVTRIGLINQ